MMLDLEKTDGFVIDLTTEEKTNKALEIVLAKEEDRQEFTLQEKRDLILEYYLYTYWDGYIMVKQANLYQIIEEDLTTTNSQDFLLALAEETNDKLGLDKLRCCFTAYCLQNDLNCDTQSYDMLSRKIYNIVSNNAKKEDVVFWSFDKFDLWISEFLC